MKGKQKSYSRRSRDQIQGLLAQFRVSGQSKHAFAMKKGIHYHTLLRWLKNSDLVDGIPGRQAGFAEVKAEPGPEQAFAEVQDQSGFLIRFYRPVPATYLLELIGR